LCDLFSGCGGISVGVDEGARSLGMDVEHVLAWDIMDEARLAYSENFNPQMVRGDPIEEVINGNLGEAVTEAEASFMEEIGDLDMVVGGPPCQGHSDLNNHSRRDDPKNDLYLRMTRFIEIFRPKVAIIENVITVRRSRSRVTQITNEFLESIGYQVQQGVIRAIDLGVAQDRRRHFTVALRDTEVPPGIFESKRVSKPRTVLWPLKGLGKVDPESVFNSPSTHQIQNVERIAWLFGKDWTDEEKNNEEFNFGTKQKPFAYNLINPRRPKCHQNGHNYPAVYGRMFPDKPAPTMTCGFGSTGQGRFVHPDYPRTMTPHEVARLQSFPDFFVFSDSIKRRAMHMLIGNAVPPAISEHVSRLLLSRII
jgi:DNA (cytosine-5)-methyltransferase 1